MLLQFDKNARNIDKSTVNNDKIDFVSMDVSFISITKILSAIYNIIDEDTCFISLLKPQFEARKEDVQKGGIITDENMHKEIILNVLNYAAANKFDIIDLNYSPIKGPSGNIEFLVNLKKSNSPKIFGMDDEKLDEHIAQLIAQILGVADGRHILADAELGYAVRLHLCAVIAAETVISTQPDETVGILHDVAHRVRQ